MKIIKTAAFAISGAAALVMVGAGTSVASHLITSADIKDDSVRSKDIKNGTILPKDLNDYTKQSLKGQDGAQGPAGPAGPQGPAGPAGADGKDGALLGGIEYYTAPGEWIDVDGDGYGDALWANVQCPAGTILTGGGNDNYTLYNYTFIDSPDLGKGWDAVTMASELDGDVKEALVAYAVCYNPDGKSTTAMELAPAPKKQANIQERVEKRFKAQQ